MKATILSVIIAVALIGGTIVLTKNSHSQEVAHNVSIVDGKQIIEIHAKGGYLPKKSFAKAGVPTILRFNTNGTFDCSASAIIPSLNIAKVLPQSGITDIDVGVREVATLHGTCSMGMYPFEVEFQG